MNDKYECIILKQIDYKENDIIVSALVKDLGKLSFICKGAKKVNSKNSMSIRPFLNSEFIFDYNDLKTIFNLKSSNILKNRKNIDSNLFKISVSSIISEIVDSIENDFIDDEIFKILDFCLDKINLGDELLVLCFFISKLLDVFGCKPIVDYCVLCGSKNINSISVDDGGFICKNCLNNYLYKYSISNLKNFRLINKANFKDYEILKDNCSVDMSDIEIFMLFLKKYTDIFPKSYEFLKKIT